MAVGDGVSALASLAVTFGGFSPTLMDGVEETKAQVERVQQALADRRKANLRQLEIERARASSPKRFTDERGMTWTYVVMDESFIRIDACRNAEPVTVIPAEVEGMPVRALGSDIFHDNERVEEIICPDSVESIASCAFRLTVNLKRVVFPPLVSNYRSSWLQRCDYVEEVVLPGQLDVIDNAVFEKPTLRKLHVGKAVLEIKQGACEKTQLEEFAIDAENPFLWTDGDGVYTCDGKVFVALARPVRSYEIRNGCETIAKKAFMGIRALEEATIPDTVTAIKEFAFAHTGLHDAKVPGSVVEIEPKAFFHCLDLRSVELDEGLKVLGESAFAESGLESIYIPASIESIGTSVTARSKVVHSGEEATFAINPQSKSLFFDGQGGLYRREDDGIHFIQLIDRDVEEYTVFPGTCYIDEYAFAYHDHITHVTLPESVLEVRQKAFRVCSRLKSVDIPESLVSIGKEAFIDTMLESLYLPAGLSQISDDAFITVGAHRMGEPPSLRTIVVNEDNPYYYVESGLLCRRGDKGDRGIVFNDDVEHVVIPEGVTSIADFAFNNARNIKTISIGPNLKLIGSCGLSPWCSIELIHIELAKPVEGRTVFDVRFPDTPRTPHEIAISLGGSSWVNVPEILRHYDNCLANAHNYHEPQADEPSAYEQASLMLARLKDPIMLVPVNRSMFERIIREHIREICVDVARHDDRSVVDDLCDFGFINGDNIEDIVVAVGKLQDAAMSGYLLELKRRRFGRAAFDFDL